jgi:uncharacterized protein YukE
MQNIIEGPLMEQITALDREANTLSQPNVWDGKSASQFRGQWPEIHSKLKAVKEAVSQLRQAAQNVQDDIRTRDTSGM